MEGVDILKGVVQGCVESAIQIQRQFALNFKQRFILNDLDFLPVGTSVSINYSMIFICFKKYNSPAFSYSNKIWFILMNSIMDHPI